MKKEKSRWYVGSRHAILTVNATSPIDAARQLAGKVERSRIARRVCIRTIDHFGPVGASCFSIEFQALADSRIDHPIAVFVMPWTWENHDGFKRGEWGELLAELKADAADPLCFKCAEFVNGFCPYRQSPQQKTCARFRGEK
jgi:hypothetical protein